MTRVCTVCRHPQRAAIDKALVDGLAVRVIAERYGALTHTSVLRHKETCLPATVVKAKEAENIDHAIDIARQLTAINRAALSILAEARQAGDPATALRAIDRIQRQIELQAKLLGQLDERPVVNVLVSAEWLQVRSALLTALAPYPEARVAVAERLRGLEGGHDAASL
jgi:hypothetical protein